MRNELNRAGTCCFFYVAGLLVILSTFLVSGYFGLSQAAYAALDVPSAKAEQTRLDIVTANAREIRAALARPVQQPQPLGPIREKSAHGLGGPNVLARQSVKQKLTPEAENAFASSSASYASNSEPFDRHRPN